MYCLGGISVITEIDLTMQDEVNCTLCGCGRLTTIDFKGSGIASVTLCGQDSSLVGGFDLEAVYVILERHSDLMVSGKIDREGVIFWVYG